MPSSTTVGNPRQVLINLVGSLTLADHMGDAMDDAMQALKQVGIEPPEEMDDDDFDLGDWLARNHGATTVWGTSLLEEDDNV
jgi:hypothetical protein